MITDRDITDQVALTIQGTDNVETIDVVGIVREIIATYGLGDIGDIEDDEYWAIVARHDSTQAPPL